MKRLLPLLFGALILAGAPPAQADTFYPVGSKGDRSVGEVRYDVSIINSTYAMSMPDDMPTVTCSALRQGAGETNLVSMGETSGIPHRVSQVTVFSSEFHFCPEYY